MILNINQLRAFYTAAKLEGLTRAAQELMVTPPAVTMQVKQLEETLGLRLMFREGNSIRLTEVGTRVFERAETIFSKIRDMENYLEDISTAKSGELRIGSPQTPAKYIIPRLIARFKETYPGIKIILDLGSTSAMVKSILSHENELAFLRYKPDEKRFRVKVIGQEDVLLLAASGSTHLPADEVSVNQLGSVPFIMPKQGSGIRDVILEYLNRFIIKPNIVMESASTDVIKELIRQETGVSFLEKYAVQEELNNNVFKSIRILEGAPKIQFGIGYHQKKHLSPAAWSFLRLLDKYKDIFPR